MKHYQERIFIEKYPLSLKKPLKKTLLHIILPFLLGLLVLFMLTKKLVSTMNYSLLTLGGLFVGICLIAIIFLYIYQYWYYKTYFYNVTDEHLIIRKGFVAPQEVTLPLRRIQDIYVDQDVLDQLFGLYDVHFSSATATSGQKAHIDGVEKETAEKLRELILHKIQEKR